MSAGTVKFYVDDVECPDTHGVGVNAIGGVFNCNLWGTKFVARCTEVCTPAMNVIEMQIYVYSALTAEGTAYVLDGNVNHPKWFGDYLYQYDHDKAWNLGSYYTSTTPDEFSEEE